MEKKKYQDLVNNTVPLPDKKGNLVISFISGGIIGMVSEIIRLLLINYFSVKNTDAISIILFGLILLSCFLTAFCDYDKLVIKFKAGLIIPITGFAHSVQSSIMDYKKDGLITGMGSNYFKLAGSVILYGLVSAFILALLKGILYG